MKTEIILAALALINALEAERRAFIMTAQRAVNRSRKLRIMIRDARRNPYGARK
jgi:hypothetical protein